MEFNELDDSDIRAAKKAEFQRVAQEQLQQKVISDDYCCILINSLLRRNDEKKKRRRQTDGIKNESKRHDTPTH